MLLVEQEKNIILQNALKQGDVALNDIQDKFLVKTVAIKDKEMEESLNESDEDITKFWESSVQFSDAIANRKLTVQYSLTIDPNKGQAQPPPSTPVSSMGAMSLTNGGGPLDLTPDVHLRSELMQLRQKYAQLESAFYNVCAERDALQRLLQKALQNASS